MASRIYTPPLNALTGRLGPEISDPLWLANEGYGGWFEIMNREGETLRGALETHVILRWDFALDFPPGDEAWDYWWPQQGWGKVGTWSDAAYRFWWDTPEGRVQAPFPEFGEGQDPSQVSGAGGIRADIRLWFPPITFWDTTQWVFRFDNRAQPSGELKLEIPVGAAKIGVAQNLVLPTDANATGLGHVNSPAALERAVRAEIFQGDPSPPVSIIRAGRVPGGIVPRGRRAVGARR